MYVRVFYGCGEDLRSNGSVGQGHKGMQASISKQASGQWDAKGKPIAESIGEPATVVRGLSEPSVGAVVMWYGCGMAVY